MGGKSNGFAGGAAAGGTGGLSGLLNCCGSKERLAKRFWLFDCLMSVLGVFTANAKFNLTVLVKLKNIITISITESISTLNLLIN